MDWREELQVKMVQHIQLFMGAGNDPVSVVISDSEHYLNTTDARIMMEAVGGSSTCQPEGFGGGIII